MLRILVSNEGASQVSWLSFYSTRLCKLPTFLHQALTIDHAATATTSKLGSESQVDDRQAKGPRPVSDRTVASM